jgi:hypothetical protein
MKRQVDVGLFVRTVAWGMAQNGAESKAMAIANLKREYPFKDGWEVISIQNVHLNPQGNDPEGLTFSFGLVKYEYSDD